MLIAKNNFVATIAPYIVKYARENNIPFASPIIAQAVIESNYGQSSLSRTYNNYFGLKCGSKWKGKSVNLKTREEYKVGTLTTIKDNFRVYDDIDSGVKGYFDFISTKRYANLKQAKTPYEYCALLKQDGYATSSSYVNTLYNCITRLNLTKYDGTMPVIMPTIDVVENVNTTKSLEVVVTEVIMGLWGNGRTRKKKLEEAGYNYSEVQKAVNAKLRKK